MSKDRGPYRTPFGPETPEYRYQNDPTFRTVVDMLESIVHRAQLTPSEIREAAMLACIHYELHRPPDPIRIPVGED